MFPSPWEFHRTMLLSVPESPSLPGGRAHHHVADQKDDRMGWTHSSRASKRWHRQSPYLLASSCLWVVGKPLSLKVSQSRCNSDCDRGWWWQQRFWGYTLPKAACSILNTLPFSIPPPSLLPSFLCLSLLPFFLLFLLNY